MVHSHDFSPSVAAISSSSWAKVDAPSIGPLARLSGRRWRRRSGESFGDAFALEPAGNEGRPEAVAGAGRIDLVTRKPAVRSSPSPSW